MKPNRKATTHQTSRVNIFQKFMLFVLVVVSFYIGVFYKDATSLRKEKIIDGAIIKDSAESKKGDSVIADVNVEGPSDSDSIRGNRDAKYALIEYSDFDCPYSAKFHKTGAQFINEYGEEVMWVYRHLPLSTMHPYAESKAIASECARLQAGNTAFWAYADELFIRQNELINTKTELKVYLNSIAKKVGLNLPQFESCYDNKNTTNELNNDIATAQTAEVEGTPGNFLLNIETGFALPLNGAVSLDVLKNSLEIIK